MKVAPLFKTGLHVGIIHARARDVDAVPVAVGAVYFLSPPLMTAASLSLDRIAGYEGPGPLDQRSASLTFGTLL